MCSLETLLSASRNLDNVTIEATVDTGFERIAEEECRDKFGSKMLLHRARGRVCFNVPIERSPMIRTLRSVNNLFLFVYYFPDIKINGTGEQISQETDLQTIGQLTEEIPWEKYLNIWKGLVNFPGILYPSREEYLKCTSALAPSNESGVSNEIERSSNEENSKGSTAGKNEILRYRVTCYRSGHHSFGSQDAARSFGGRLQDLFNWVVNLRDYELEIILKVDEKNVRVLFAITDESLHNRNLSYFGITTLRSTISFNLLEVAKPVIGDVIMDPLCGSGSIPIEGASRNTENFYICGDINSSSVNLVDLNKIAYRNRYGKHLLVDPLRWDVCALPLRNSCIDVITTDLPFGKRVGSKRNNKVLYPNAMKELARVVRPTSGRAVLLTTDRRSYDLSLQQNVKYWKQLKMMIVKIGGLKACVYLLQRTNYIFK